jgi:hypothetical protein
VPVEGGWGAWKRRGRPKVDRILKTVRRTGHTSFPPILICSLEGIRNYVPTIPINLQ